MKPLLYFILYLIPHIHRCKLMQYREHSRPKPRLKGYTRISPTGTLAAVQGARGPSSLLSWTQVLGRFATQEDVFKSCVQNVCEEVRQRRRP